MQDGGDTPRAAREPIGFLRRIVEGWALLGGLLLLVITLLVTYSSAASALWGRPLPGDVELVEMLTAISVFMFLPYCQLAGANVTADIFTARAGERTIAALELLAALVALGFSLLMFWRMYEGLLDYRKYVETTTILKIPIWVAYPWALASLALLAVAAAACVRKAARGL